MEISRRAIANAKTLKPSSGLGDKFIERNLIGAVSLNTTDIFPQLPRALLYAYEYLFRTFAK